MNNWYGNIESIIAANYIRYEKLAELINKAYNGSTASNVNILIDMYSCIRRLYESNDNLVASNDYMSITASMLNMCAHYRHYFRRYLGVESRIFIVMSHNSNSIQTKMVDGWNYSYIKNRRMNTAIDSLIEATISFLGTLCPYLPDIHFVLSGHESTVVMDNLLYQYGRNMPNIIIARDIVPMQLISRYQETCVLRPKKSHGDDLSYILGPFRDKESIIRYWKYYELNYNKTPYDGICIHPCNTNLLLAMSGSKDRSMRGFIMYKKAKQYIFNVVGDMAVCCSPESLFEINDITEFSMHNLIPRYNALNVDFLAQYFNTSPEYSLLQDICNNQKSNPIEVRRINDSYFTNCPIDLDKL